MGCAFIVLKQGTNVSEKELVKFMRSKLARYKVPKRIIIVNELPKTSAGKIAKRELDKQACDFVKKS